MSSFSLLQFSHKGIPICIMCLVSFSFISLGNLALCVAFTTSRDTKWRKAIANCLVFYREKKKLNVAGFYASTGKVGRNLNLVCCIACPFHFFNLDNEKFFYVIFTDSVNISKMAQYSWICKVIVSIK